VHLYSGSTAEFIGDATRSILASKLEERFQQHFRYRPSRSEVVSWQNSLGRMAQLLAAGDLNDNGIVVELQLPLTSRRLDCMITGNGDFGPSAAIVELKQWDEVRTSPVDGCVEAFLGHDWRDLLHPSEQASRYQRYLLDTHSTFSEGSVRLTSCAWLHNLVDGKASPLFDPRFATVLSLAPSFTGEQSSQLEGLLVETVGGGAGLDVLEEILRGRYRPHKRLLDHVARTVREEPSYVLLDEQQVAYAKVLGSVRSRGLDGTPAVFLIRGGPGTGKSVIAVNLVGDLARLGYSVHHATGSKAFTETLKSVVGHRAGALFNYFNSYAQAGEGEIDVLVLDEAHRIRESSVNRFTKKDARSGLPQVDELIRAAHTSVFFIDDLQVVRPGEVGSSILIREAASRLGATLVEHELEAQFRCGGSDRYVRWVTNLLELDRTPDVLWDTTEEFDLDVVDDPRELEALIRMRAAEGATARLSAGYCWPWSDPENDGTLVRDVEIGDWAMPWNAKPDSKRLAPGIPKANRWASDPGGIEQVGCVYTAQGFEYDYAGVIWGRDLVWRAREGWVGQPEFSRDGYVTRNLKSSQHPFVDLVKHTYRVLLTRGLKGCFLHIQDIETRNFVLSRIERTR
jgi:DUF2075 family protein